MAKLKLAPKASGFDALLMVALCAVVIVSGFVILTSLSRSPGVEAQVEGTSTVNSASEMIKKLDKMTETEEMGEFSKLDRAASGL